jgi:hypothetical protein
MVAENVQVVRTNRVNYVTRPRLFMWLAFAFFVIAAFVGGGIIANHDIQWEWLVAGGLASYVLASLE